MDNSFTIRRAQREDCPAMLGLVRELAAFERAPDAVTVTPEHFEESGFGDRPVWWAFVACAPAGETEKAEAVAAESIAISTAIQDPVLAGLMAGAQPAQDEIIANTAMAAPATGGPEVTPMIQLDAAVEPVLPEGMAGALPVELESPQACEQIVGFALYYIRYSTWKGQRMYLEDIFVTEAWRGHGMGTALMDALIGAAVADGLRGISWQVLDWNERAIKFYERYGAQFSEEWLNASIDV